MAKWTTSTVTNPLWFQTTKITINKLVLNLELSIEPELMEGFKNTYHS
jgi:hypothetical protein